MGFCHTFLLISEHPSGAVGGGGGLRWLLAKWSVRCVSVVNPRSTTMGRGVDVNLRNEKVFFIFQKE